MRTVSLSTFLRLPDRLRWHLHLLVRIRVNGTTLLVPSLNGVGIPPERVSPTWKSEVIRRLGTGRTGAFLDVGANIGQTLLDFALAGVALDYIGFEPNPACIPLVEAMATANGIAATVVPAGLAEHAGVARLFRDDVNGEEWSERATLLSELRPGRSSVGRTVVVAPFEGIRRDLGIERVALVKIDVEGSEAAALAGMGRTLTHDRPPILCEVLGADTQETIATSMARTDRLRGLLRDADYQIARLRFTDDESRLLGIEPIEDFPAWLWTEQNQHQHDYVFVPTERASDLLDALS